MRAILVVLVLSCMGGAWLADAKGQATACAVGSSPEVITLYGDGNTVLQKLEKYKLDLPARRFYMFVVEKPDSAQLSVYEEGEGGKYKLLKWTDGSAGEINANLSRVILENKGLHCVGEQSKAVLSKLKGLKDEGAVPAPATGAAAIAHSLKDIKDFVRVTIYLMC